MSTTKKLTALALACGAAIGATSVQAGVLAGGMKELVRESETADARLPRHLGLHITNRAGEPMVHVHLAQGTDLAKTLPQLKAAGFKLTAASKIDRNHLEGFLTLRQAKALAAVPGVKSVVAVQRPVKFAGSVQSQAVALQKADLVQAKGVDGTGIKVAALSDSFDACTACFTHAADDVASGDLPAAGVTVQADIAAGTGEDEGRAMLQLIHDVAPGAQLGFATAFNGEVDFSNQILDLRRVFGADVIVDDVIYFDEPMFSDGILAQAVDTVSAEGAAYYSSAGNNGLEAYEATYHPISFDNAVKIVTGGGGNLKLEQIPEAIRPKTIHVFKGGAPDGKSIALSEKFTSAADNRMSFQWDEPFNLGKVKTDYNLYVFDAAGNWLDPATAPTVFYTTDDNTATDQPWEFIETIPDPTEIHGGAASTTYQFVIGKMNDGPANHIKYVNINGLGVGQFHNAPSLFGHAAAKGGQAVAATYYAIPNFPEDFSAPGPVTIAFDNAGHRLATPEVRNVPQITAADGVDTTFFGFDADLSGFPNFFGTSAAAPDAAATAALVLQAAGGPGSLAPAALYDAIDSTATPLPVPDNRSHASAVAGPVSFNAKGDWTRWMNYFGLAVDAGATSTVSTVTMDLTNLPLTFNTNLARFNVGDVNGFNPANVSVTCTPDGKVYTLTFVPGTFGAGQSFRFGTSLFNPIQGSTQEDPDRMRGMIITAKMADGSTYTETVHARPKEMTNRFTGAGLVNAKAAVKAVTGR
jgi:hypothetical protein